MSLDTRDRNSSRSDRRVGHPYQDSHVQRAELHDYHSGRIRRVRPGFFYVFSSRNSSRRGFPRARCLVQHRGSPWPIPQRDRQSTQRTNLCDLTRTAAPRRHGTGPPRSCCRSTPRRTDCSASTGLEERIFGRLPDATWIYPGHGNNTTLGAEHPRGAARPGAGKRDHDRPSPAWQLRHQLRG
jgi:hypothetical protein